LFQTVTLSEALDCLSAERQHLHDLPPPPPFLKQASKADAVEAVQAFAPEQFAKLKKNDLASEAKRLAAGSGWLPAMLPTPLEAAACEAWD